MTIIDVDAQILNSLRGTGTTMHPIYNNFDAEIPQSFRATKSIKSLRACDTILFY